MPATPAASCSTGHVPKKYLPIDLFDIHVRLYRCVKNLDGENLANFLVNRQFRQILAAQKFPSIRYSILHGANIKLFNYI